MKASLLLPVVAPLVLLAGCASSGYEISQASADSMNAAITEVDTLGAHRQTAIEAMNALLAEPMENLPAKFKAFSAATDEMAGAQKDLASAVKKMKVATSNRFIDWKNQESAYADASIRARSEQNRAQAEETFRAAADASDQMVATGSGFVSFLSDLRMLLSNDLTPRGVSGAADLARNARSANGRLHQMTQPALEALRKAAEALSTR